MAEAKDQLLVLAGELAKAGFPGSATLRAEPAKVLASVVSQAKPGRPCNAVNAARAVRALRVGKAAQAGREAGAEAAELSLKQ
ncbi:MAG: hypothetical protein ACQEQX_05945 [Thermodesulfobacteriota bacterium]